MAPRAVTTVTPRGDAGASACFPRFTWISVNRQRYARVGLAGLIKSTVGASVGNRVPCMRNSLHLDFLPAYGVVFGGVYYRLRFWQQGSRFRNSAFGTRTAMV